MEFKPSCASFIFGAAALDYACGQDNEAELFAFGTDGTLSGARQMGDLSVGETERLGFG